MSSGKPVLLVAILVAFILVIGGIIAMLISSTEEAEDELEDEEEEFSPHAMFPNLHVTDMADPNNEPSIVVNPDDPDNIVAASNDYGTPSGDAWCGFYASFDRGETWERGLVPGYDGDRDSPLWRYQGGGDPVLAFGEDGNCYLAGIAFQRDLKLGNLIKPGTGIFVARSTDGGRTFDQVSMVIQSYSMYTTFHDKEWIAVDPTTGDVHVTWTAFNFLEFNSAIVHSVSHDFGQTWSFPTVLSEISERERQVQGSQVAVDSDGVVHVSWIDYDRGALRYTRSYDQGESFDDVREVASVTPLPYYLPNGEYRTPTMCAMAVDTSGGNRSGSVYIAWPDHSGGEGDILMVSSSNNGDTFTSPVRVNQDTEGNGADQFFPAVTVGADGSVQLIFYDRRDDAENNTLLGVYYAISKDGGKTFIDLPLSEVSFDGDDSRDTPFIGDYLAIAATPEGWSVGVWCDTREGGGGEYRSDIWCGFARYMEV